MKTEKMWVAVEIKCVRGPGFHEYLKSNLDSYESWCTDGNSVKRTGRFSIMKSKPTGKIEWETDIYGNSMRNEY